MDEFPSNSHNVLGASQIPNQDVPKKDVQKVVSVDAIQRKKPLRRRIRDLFFRGEFKGATRYIGSDVLLPALRNMVVDATEKGIERVVYGDAPRRRYDAGRPRISYNSPIDRGPVDRYSRDPRSRAMLPDQPPIAPRRRQEAGEIILVSRTEAELVVERLTDIVDKYDVASVADLHELVGLPTSYVDNKWGWSALRGVDIRQVREGYLIDLPPVEPI